MTSPYHDATEILGQIGPPDPQLVDLIDQLFLEWRIDGQRADLVYLRPWMYETASRFAQICAQS
jgi:hypothetical protein